VSLPWTLALSASNINDMTFVSSDTGYACANSGVIYKSTDGGFTWSTLSNGTLTVQNLNSVSFVDSTTGYFAGASGALIKSASSMGGTSTVQLRRDISNAANDPNVSAIMLAIDSPGGTAAGTYELGAAVKRASSLKPTWAFVEDLGASAAYWMASQASQIFAANPMTQVGSIGTYWTLYDTSKMLEADGVKVHHFATGPLKGAGAYGTVVTEEQAAHFQAQVDTMQTHFDEAVRLGRNLSRNELASVRTGGVFSAKEAQALKLIDGIKSFEQVLKSLAQAK